jgi:hypothetical protein
VFRVLIVALPLLLHGLDAAAQTLGAGPAIAATQIVDDLLADVTTAGAALIGIGLFAVALGFFAGLPIERFASGVVAGAILAAGSTVTTMVLGAELPCP